MALSKRNVSRNSKGNVWGGASKGKWPTFFVSSAERIYRSTSCLPGSAYPTVSDVTSTCECNIWRCRNLLWRRWRTTKRRATAATALLDETRLD